MTPKYPNVTVQLSDEDGNAIAIMARVQRALKKAGATPEEISQYSMDSMSGDYDNLIRAQMKWVNIK